MKTNNTGTTSVPRPDLQSVVETLTHTERAILRTLVTSVPNRSSRTRVSKAAVAKTVRRVVETVFQTAHHLRELRIMRFHTLLPRTPSVMSVQFRSPKVVTQLKALLSANAADKAAQSINPQGPMGFGDWAMPLIKRGDIEKMLLCLARAPYPSLFKHMPATGCQTRSLVLSRWGWRDEPCWPLHFPDWLWAAFHAQPNCAQAMRKSRCPEICQLAARRSSAAALKAMDAVCPTPAA